ncbi:unannotated protein [freshwater metagenome]|uniref:Unannotated protein n=1 Tax=freshwater metagenome TaxID=449393 RepID=A0A6J7DA91_9ZZZZ|nr:SRPBCC family protein [Actinomycetota bacterium]
MLTYETHSDASPEQVWELMARPEHWHRWARHLRPLRFGAGEVSSGEIGIVLVLGVPVVARIGAVEPGVSWNWHTGIMRVDHRVDADGPGSRITISVHGARPVLAGARTLYEPLLRRALERLARLAEPGT